MIEVALAKGSEVVGGVVGRVLVEMSTGQPNECLCDACRHRLAMGPAASWFEPVGYGVAPATRGFVEPAPIPEISLNKGEAITR